MYNQDSCELVNLDDYPGMEVNRCHGDVENSDIIMSSLLHDLSSHDLIFSHVLRLEEKLEIIILYY